MKMTKDEINALKAMHRIEDIMQERGEAFEIDANNSALWHGTTTKGLMVNIHRQSYELKRPGLEAESGDLIAWLKRRHAWTFGMVIRYLQKRAPVQMQKKTQRGNIQPGTAERKPKQYKHYFESETPNADAEVSGLYECGRAYKDGKTYYSYSLKPCDRLQEWALEIGGEKMREYFAWKAEILHLEMSNQPTRFTPVQDMTVVHCDECEKPINWFWKQEPQFVFQEASYNPLTYKRVQRIPEPDVYGFEYEQWEETFCICSECKNKKINYRRALELLYKSAYQREAPERERQTQIGSARQSVNGYVSNSS